MCSGSCTHAEMACVDSCGIFNEVLAALSQLDIKRLVEALEAVKTATVSGIATGQNEGISNNAYQCTYSSQQR